MAIKPAYYAALSHLTALAIDNVLKDWQSPEPASDYLYRYPYLSGDSAPDLALQIDIASTFQHRTSDLFTTPRFQARLKTMQKLQSLRNFEQLAILTQIQAGAETASSTMLTLIKNVPRLVGSLDPSVPEESYPAIARASHRLGWQLAMMGINQLFYGQISLSSQAVDWDKPGTELKPDQFVLRREQSELRLDFVGIENVKPTEISQPLQKIVNYEPLTLGCPVTFLPKEFIRLWHWMTQLSIEHGLLPKEPGRPS